MTILLLAVFLLPALFSPERLYAEGSLQRVSLTYSSRSIASIDLFIAQDRGFFRDEGLDAQLIQVRATAAIAALVSGEVHALGSIGSAIRAIPRGAPIRVLAVSLRRPVFWLVSGTLVASALAVQRTALAALVRRRAAPPADASVEPTLE